MVILFLFSEKKVYCERYDKSNNTCHRNKF